MTSRGAGLVTPHKMSGSSLPHRDKRVAIIGAGVSGLQVIEMIFCFLV